MIGLSFKAPKFTADGDCSHKIKKHLLLGAMVFPLVIYGCESWTIKKAEHRRIDALNCGVEKDSLESLG